MGINSNTIWDMKGVDTNDTAPQYVLRHRFIAQSKDEAITVAKVMVLTNVSQLDVADVVGKLLNANITGDNADLFTVVGELDNHPVYALVSCGPHTRHQSGTYPDDDDEVAINERFKVNSIKVEVTGHRKAIAAIMTHLGKCFNDAKVASVRWWYRGPHGNSSREMYLEPPKTVLRPEFYPGLGDPYDYIQRYLKSDQSILLMAGQPGTGKTSMLRHMLCDNYLIADVVYDEAIMNDDAMFQSFLFSKSQIMIIEDADLLLGNRDEAQNSLMSRFLNISDGLIKLPGKKLIFTTNINDFNRVDPALTRPGRCFDVMHTRALTYAEACAAAKVAGLSEPSEHREYTLAEIWNQTSNRHERTMGFIQKKVGF